MSIARMPVFVPVSLCLLLAACGATTPADAQAAATTTATNVAPATEAPPTGLDWHDDSEDGPEADSEQDDELELVLDENGEYDPAAHLRAQLAQRAPPAGSGGPVQACQLSGSIQVLGLREDVRDCMQSNGKYSVAEFHKACEGLANALVGGGNAPARIDYMGSCPTPAQGSCKNVLNTGLDGFYYQRGADNLAALPASCTGAGGTWIPGR